MWTLAGMWTVADTWVWTEAGMWTEAGTGFRLLFASSPAYAVRGPINPKKKRIATCLPNHVEAVIVCFVTDPGSA